MHAVREIMNYESIFVISNSLEDIKFVVFIRIKNNLNNNSDAFSIIKHFQSSTIKKAQNEGCD